MRSALSAPPLALAGLALLGLAGCATPVATRVETAQAIDRILAGDHRSQQNRARDVHRHPKETLLFFGVRPEHTIVEVWPGTGAWYTEVLAPLVKGKGRYYAAHWAPDPSSKFVTDALESFRRKLESRPDLYDEVVVTALGPGRTEIAPAGSADVVLTFRNIHNWMARDWARQAFEAMYAALKPGGVLGVVEHRGPGGDQDPKARNGYVNEDYAIELIESVGFRLVGKSEINANPKDTKDYQQGVWTLPPTFRMGDQDREKYAAIGESDRFTLKFVKPAR